MKIARALRQSMMTMPTLLLGVLCGTSVVASPITQTRVDTLNWSDGGSAIVSKDFSFVSFDSSQGVLESVQLNWSLSQFEFIADSEGGCEQSLLCAGTRTLTLTGSNAFSTIAASDSDSFTIGDGGEPPASPFAFSFTSVSINSMANFFPVDPFIGDGLSSVTGLTATYNRDGFKTGFGSGAVDISISLTYDFTAPDPEPNHNVPTPTTLALFGLGLAGLGWKRRKKA